MPVSTSVHISHCLTYIIGLKPQSVLDVGCGFGLWGFLCRMYLDVYEGRVQPAEWNTCIDGLELFEPYIQDHHRSLYSSIRIGDVRDAAAGLDAYELIIAGDIIEHLEKDEADEVLDHLYSRATRALLVNIPLGHGWDHPEQYGNPGELHRSQWEVQDFLRFPSVHKEFELPCGRYGSFFCPKDCDPGARLNGLVAAAKRFDQQGRADKALNYVLMGLELDPGHRETCFYAADLFLRAGNNKAAVETLERGIQEDPSFHEAYVMLAKLLAILGRSQEAAQWVQRFAARPDAPTDLVAKAQKLLG